MSPTEAGDEEDTGAEAPRGKVQAAGVRDGGKEMGNEGTETGGGQGARVGG